jgi:hypothetical protein
METTNKITDSSVGVYMEDSSDITIVNANLKNANGVVLKNSNDIEFLGLHTGNTTSNPSLNREAPVQKFMLDLLSGVLILFIVGLIFYLFKKKFGIKLNT